MRKPQLHLVAPFVLLVATVVVACGTVDAGPEPDVLDAAPSGEFVVTGVTEAGAPRALVRGSEIRFTFEDGRVGIRAGCNSMSGELVLEGSRMTVRNLGGTEMGCSAPLMDQDAWVAGLFDDPVQLNLGKDAAIIAGDVVLSMAPRAEVHPDKPLAGTRWVLDGYVDGDSASSAQGARLEVRGQAVQLFNGCGTLAATGTVQGARILWGPGRATLDFCVGEDELRAAIGTSAAYEITENLLTLTHGDRGATFRAAR